MRRGLLLLAGGLALFAAGVLFSSTNNAFGVVPVTPYEADVNKDSRVNAIDLGQVAQKFGQPVPTATATPLSECNLSRRVIPSGVLQSATNDESQGFNHCNFSRATLDGSSLLGNFVGADFTDATLTGSGLRFANLWNATLIRADLRNTWMIQAYLREANLTGANLDGADAQAAYFYQANLTQAALTQIDARGARFDYSNLTGAVISGAPGISNPFKDAIFQYAITTGADVSAVAWGPNTICPDGTNSDNNGGSCIGHGFAGTPLATWTPTATPTATATPDTCTGGSSAVRWAAGNNHCYILFTTPLSWTGAKAACEQAEAHLVTMADAAENAFIYDIFGHADRWIGFTDAPIEGQWEWVTGEAVTYTNWGAGEPNDGNGSYPYEDGALLQIANGQWNDGYDGFTMSYVCEREN